jgi:predicted nucleic acid-binding protein
VIVLDTSGVVALQDRRDARYAEALEAMREEPGPFVLPLGILAEIDAVLSARSAGAMTQVLGSLLDGSLLLDCGDADPPRIVELMGRGGEPRLGFADAAVVACAERNGGRILTFDRSPFEALARELPITLLPPG